MGDIAANTFPKSIEIKTLWQEGPWSIEGDPTQLHQVLLNLAVNARDAMPEGGRLELATENVELDEATATTMAEAKPGPHVLLRVTDNGAGMSPETMEKMFDPFFTTKQPGKGTGLGLSTTLGIVKSHGGFLTVESEPNQGTTFRIYLPAFGIQPAAASLPAASIPRGDNELILVIDDEEFIRQVAKSILEENGYRVLEAKDGPEALAVFAQERDSVQLVLSDLMLPHMEGTALLRALKEMKPDVSIIASTGADDPETMNALELMGITRLLNKPYDRRTLLAAAHEALASAR